jgi:NAD-dependent SIR2 family protein deacetylase
MFGLFSSKPSCFNCGNKTKKDKASTITLDTAEGKHEIFACPKCSGPFNELLEALEDVKNGVED